MAPQGLVIYHYLDRRPDDLAPASRSLVRAMRRWTAGVQAGRCPCAAIASALRLARQDDGTAHFAMLMATLAHDSTRRMYVAPCERRAVTDDEAAILVLHDLAVRGEMAALRRSAASLVAADAVSRLTTAITLLAAVLQAASLQPNNPNDQDPR